MGITIEDNEELEDGSLTFEKLQQVFEKARKLKETLPLEGEPKLIYGTRLS